MTDSGGNLAWRRNDGTAAPRSRSDRLVIQQCKVRLLLRSPDGGSAIVIAAKRVLAWQLELAMEKRQMSKGAMARAMRTGRSRLDRILDSEDDHIRLDTLTTAANVLGLSLRIELVGWRPLPVGRNDGVRRTLATIGQQWIIIHSLANTG